jgi:hypothetical protein
MRRQPDLGRKESTERQDLGKATPREGLWPVESVSRVATAMTIHNHSPKRGWRFCSGLVITGVDQNTWKLR